MEKKKTYVGQSVVKRDAMALMTGKPVYTDDIAPKDCLIVKVLRSPHAHAWIEEIDKTRALSVPGIETILTWEDSPQKRFTMAGQTYPEPSPYDRLILDRRMRFVGDVAAIVAGTSEEAVDRALKAIKVNYQVLEPVLDMRTAKDNPVLVHPEENWESLCPVGADNQRNLCASGDDIHGDVEGILASCAQDLSCKAEPAGHDGNLPHLYIYGCLWTAERNLLYSGALPCAADSGSCLEYSQVPDPGDKAPNRWRLWGQADGGFRGIPGSGDLGDRQTG